MNQELIVRLLNTDPVARKLIESPIHARIAYTSLEGEPRVVPVGYAWNGSHFVFATHVGAPKVRALEADPRVAITIDSSAFPPNVLLVRGNVTSLEQVDGLPDAHIEASRRFIGEAMMPEWEAESRRTTTAMVVISIKPDWIKIIDFETRFPGRPNPPGT